jgi:hypothetical protein
MSLQEKSLQSILWKYMLNFIVFRQQTHTDFSQDKVIILSML